MTDKIRLRTSLEAWRERNDAELRHEDSSPLGERYELQWTNGEDDTLVRFIDVYPKDANRIAIQKGIFEKPPEGPAENTPSEEVRAKGTFYYRTVDQVTEALSQLKPFTDGMSRAHLPRS